MSEKLHTLEETAHVLRLSTSTLYKLSAKKIIGHYKIGRRCYFLESDVGAFLATRRREALPKAGE